MSAGHRQRGPQEGHSTMEEGEEMRDEENEESTTGFKEHEGGRREQIDRVDEKKKMVDGKMMIGEGAQILCFCCVRNLWVVSK